MQSKYIDVPTPIIPRRVCEGAFFGSDIEPGTFHGPQPAFCCAPRIAPKDVRVDDRDDVNEPQAHCTSLVPLHPHRREPVTVPPGDGLD